MKVLFFAALLYVLVVAVLSRRHLRELHPRRFFLETWMEADRAAAEARARRLMEGKGHDWRPLIAFVLVVAVLAFLGAAATTLGVETRPGFDGRRFDS